MSLDQNPARRKGGRKQKKRDIRDAPLLHYPPLQRALPIYEVISDEQVELIHHFAMDVVEQVGCEFRDPEALALWECASPVVLRWR